MKRLTSGGFSNRDALTQKLIHAIGQTILTSDRYFKIETGIEYRFGTQAKTVHKWLYHSLGATTDLLRYFPDSLYFDLHHVLPDWEPDRSEHKLVQPAREHAGYFTFFVEFKYSRTKRARPLSSHPEVPMEYIGIIEREAWLTYHRLTAPNPRLGIYLDDQRPRIALFYAAEYTPEKLHAGWEEAVVPLHVIDKIARPDTRSVFTKGSGTPWINFDIRNLKPLEQFLEEDLFWEAAQAKTAVLRCKKMLFA